MQEVVDNFVKYSSENKETKKEEPTYLDVFFILANHEQRITMMEMLFKVGYLSVEDWEEKNVDDAGKCKEIARNAFSTGHTNAEQGISYDDALSEFLTFLKEKEIV
ncbi:MAG: hypothetical protein ACYCSO_07410 [Cuniculiplasma sp.]